MENNKIILKAVKFELYENHYINLTIGEYKDSNMLFGLYQSNIPRCLRGKKWQSRLKAALDAAL